MFSGRPNPYWELGDAQARILLRMLDEIRQSGRSHQPCHAPDLGYRGLRLKVAVGSGEADWHVFEGCLEHEGRVLDDSGRAIEAYLLQSMPEQMSRDLAAALPRIGR
jgi:hypothetical protein